MTQVFLPSGDVVPVTRVAAGPCPIVQIKEQGKNNQQAIQLGLEPMKEFRLNKPELGHRKGLEPVRHLHDFSQEKIDNLKRGDLVTVETFTLGDKVAVIGTSKGKGFQGVVKRHGFHGAPASHGHKHDLRMPGSIGAGGVQRVFKGMRMAGHMGDAQVTIKNLEVVGIDAAKNELLIKGAVPGGRNALLAISAPGELKVKTVAVEEAKTETVAAEAAPAV